MPTPDFEEEAGITEEEELIWAIDPNVKTIGWTVMTFSGKLREVMCLECDCEDVFKLYDFFYEKCLLETPAVVIIEQQRGRKMSLIEGKILGIIAALCTPTFIYLHPRSYKSYFKLETGERKKNKEKSVLEWIKDVDQMADKKFAFYLGNTSKKRLHDLTDSYFMAKWYYYRHLLRMEKYQPETPSGSS